MGRHPGLRSHHLLHRIPGGRRGPFRQAGIQLLCGCGLSSLRFHHSLPERGRIKRQNHIQAHRILRQQQRVFARFVSQHRIDHRHRIVRRTRQCIFSFDVGHCEQRLARNAHRSQCDRLSFAVAHRAEHTARPLREGRSPRTPHQKRKNQSAVHPRHAMAGKQVEICCSR